MLVFHIRNGPDIKDTRYQDLAYILLYLDNYMAGYRIFGRPDTRFDIRTDTRWEDSAGFGFLSNDRIKSKSSSLVSFFYCFLFYYFVEKKNCLNWVD